MRVQFFSTVFINPDIYLCYKLTGAAGFIELKLKVERKFESDGDHIPRVSKLENAVQVV